MPSSNLTTTPHPSSATTGFFQSKPKLRNQFHDDKTYTRVLSFLLPAPLLAQTTPDLTRWGARVLSPQILRWCANAEANPPTLIIRDSLGKPRNELVTSEGWRRLQEEGLREGIVATGYEDAFGSRRRLMQFAKMFLWCGSSSTVTCPSAMQDGAAALIRGLLESKDGGLEKGSRDVLQSAYTRLTSRDPEFAWTSGQWMTERAGGSDVRGTETRARRATGLDGADEGIWTASDGSPLGDWVVDGFKWFSSATDADMAVLLAKTGDSEDLSLFFAPTRKRKAPTNTSDEQTNSTAANDEDESATQFNGIFPQRLKNKLGTKALPTAELELKGMRAYLLGEEGKGTKEISAVLNITRIYNAVSSVGGLGRGLAISRAWATVRRTMGGKALLCDVPAHVRGLADVHVLYRGDMVLTFFVVSLLGITEEKSSVAPEEMPLLKSKTQAAHLLRLLTPVAKAMTALNSIAGLRFCMESLGGLGYLENEDVELNVAKLFRDANVLAIWEGTTDVLAADTVRVLRGARGADVLNALGTWVHDLTNSRAARGLDLDVSRVGVEVQKLRQMLGEKSTQELLYRGRELLERIHWVVGSTLLVVDAVRDRDEVAVEVARRWLARRDEGLAGELEGRPWEERAKLDREIVFGGKKAEGMEKKDVGAKL